jgi:hypothetical protein
VWSLKTAKSELFDDELGTSVPSRRSREVQMGSPAEGEIEAGFPKWENAKYFRVSPESICLVARESRAQASCCGVNLAVGGWGLVCFSGCFVWRWFFAVICRERLSGAGRVVVLEDGEIGELR